MYFNVYFKVCFFKLIKVHLLVSELYIQGGSNMTGTVYTVVYTQIILVIFEPPRRTLNSLRAKVFRTIFLYTLRLAVILKPT